MKNHPQNLQKRHDELLTRIASLDEPELRNLIMSIFGKIGYVTYYTHGASEHGADVTLEIQSTEDPLRRGQYILFQVKAGNIGKETWQSILYGQLTELYCKPIDLIAINESIPRRIVLVTSGDITQPVMVEIGHWNAKLPIPIEVLDGRRLTEFLLEMEYTAKDISELTKPRIRPLGKASKPKVKPLGVSSKDNRNKVTRLD